MAQELFVQAIRKKTRGQWLITLVTLSQISRKYCQNVGVVWQKRIEFQNKMLLYFRVCVLWKLCLRRFGQQKLFDKQRNMYVRHQITFFMQAHAHECSPVQQEAKKIMKKFFRGYQKQLLTASVMQKIRIFKD